MSRTSYEVEQREATLEHTIFKAERNRSYSDFGVEYIWFSAKKVYAQNYETSNAPATAV